MNMKALLPLILLLFGFCCEASPVRIAVIGGSEASNSAALLGVELSKQKELTLVERDQIEAVAREWKLNTGGVKDSECIRMGKLLKADGLLILSQINISGKSLKSIRLVAVGPGVVIDQLVVPEEIEANAPLIVSHFIPLLPKISAMSRKTAVPVSLLGLRFELGTASCTRSEIALNTLVAVRLAHLPDVVVLERWKLNTMAFEKSLGPTANNPFWTGGYLLDGNIMENGSQITIKARLRGGGAAGQETLIESVGDMHSQDQLAEDLARKIASKVGATTVPVAWEPQAEAQNFAQLAEWALNNGLFKEGSEAAEAAIALGDRTRKTAMLRIKGYAHVKNFVNSFTYCRSGCLPVLPENAGEQIESILQAQLYLRDYLNQNASMQEPDLHSPLLEEYPSMVGDVTNNTALQVLSDCYQAKLHLAHADALSRLRSYLLSNLKTLTNVDCPCKSWVSAQYLAESTGFCADTPEQAVALTREFWRSKMRSLYPGSFFGWSNWSHSKDPDYLIAWTPEQEARVGEVWSQFVRTLLDSPKTQDQIDGLMFQRGFMKPNEDPMPVLLSLQNLISKHADEIIRNDPEIYLEGVQGLIEESRKPSFPKLREAYFQFWTRYLRESSFINERLVLVFRYINWDKTEAAAIIPLLDAYKSRVEKSAKKDYLTLLGDVRRVIVCNYPLLDGMRSDPARILVVNRFVDLFVPKPGWERGTYFPEPASLTLAEGKLWSVLKFSERKIHCLDTQTMQAALIDFPSDPKIRAWDFFWSYLAVNPRFLCFCIDQQVFLYDRAEKTWAPLALPETQYRPQFIQDSLYLAFGDGLLKVDPRSRKSEVIISSRRVPPLNELDGKHLGRPLGLYSGPDGKLMLSIALGKTFRQEAINHWTVMFDSNGEYPESSSPMVGLCVARSGADRTMLGIGSTLSATAFEPEWPQHIKINRITSIPCGPGKIETLLADPKTEGKSLDAQARWRYPRSLSGKSPESGANTVFCMAGENLWGISDEGARDEKSHLYRLYCFKAGSKDAVEIPLTFALPSSIDPTAYTGLPGCDKQWLDQAGSPHINANGLVGTPEGLFVLPLRTPGFWFIPFADVERFMASSEQTPGNVKLQDHR